MAEDEFLNLRELAEHVGLSYDALAKYCRLGWLRFIRDHKGQRFSTLAWYLQMFAREGQGKHHPPLGRRRVRFGARQDVTAHEVAAVLGVATSTVIGWIKAGCLGSRRLGAGSMAHWATTVEALERGWYEPPLKSRFITNRPKRGGLCGG